MKKGSIFPAIFLIIIGGWFLAGNLGVNLPDMGQLWPAFILLSGVVALWNYASRQDQDPDQIFLGIAAIGVGLFFFLFTLELVVPVFGRVQWWRMAEFWPAFLLIAAAAFLGQFAWTGFRRMNLLVLGALTLAVGLVAFGFTLDLLNDTLLRQVADFWPVILIVVGLIWMMQSLLKRR